MTGAAHMRSERSESASVWISQLNFRTGRLRTDDSKRQRYSSIITGNGSALDVGG
jgi:hypothetical protein